MKTKQDLMTYVDATMDAEEFISTGSNKRFDSKIELASDDNNNDSIRGDAENNLIRTGEGNDFVRAGRGDDHVAGGDGGDVIRLGRGADKGYGGDGADFILGQRGNDWMDGGAGNDFFGAGNGSNLVRTGEGDDTVIVTYSQTKMEARAGNEQPDDADAFTTVTDFEIGSDMLHMTGISEAKALRKLTFDVSKDGTDIMDANGNMIVRLKDVQIEDTAEFIANSMDFGKFDWSGKQLEILQAGDAPGGQTKSGEFKGIDLKDASHDYAVWDFGSLEGMKPNGNGGDKFFHGSDGSLTSEGKELFSGSSMGEHEVDEFVFAMLDDYTGVKQAGGYEDEFLVTSVTEDQLVIEVTNQNTKGGNLDGYTDTIVLEGEVIEQAINEYDLFA